MNEYMNIFNMFHFWWDFGEPTEGPDVSFKSCVKTFPDFFFLTT